MKPHVGDRVYVMTLRQHGRVVGIHRAVKVNNYVVELDYATEDGKLYLTDEHDLGILMEVNE
jgi:hypothetical protein